MTRSTSHVETPGRITSRAFRIASPVIRPASFINLICSAVFRMIAILYTPNAARVRAVVSSTLSCPSTSFSLPEEA